MTTIMNHLITFLIDVGNLSIILDLTIIVDYQYVMGLSCGVE